ncbi:MAG: hypothetical protein IPM51_12240 [Sphingobacteriaceae bacterium]|nr:hypothetical protein [Sphingobacteriaceae bacterium]
MSEPTEDKTIVEPQAEEPQPEVIKEEPPKEPIRIERQFDPDKQARRKEKQRIAQQKYKAKLKERASNGDEKAKAIIDRQLGYLQQLKETKKQDVQEIKKLKQDEISEKKRILEETDKKIEELKNIQINLPQNIVEKPELPNNIVTKEKYKKLKERVNKLEGDLKGRKPAFRRDIYDKLFS